MKSLSEEYIRDLAAESMRYDVSLDDDFVISVLPNMAEGQLQTSGNLIGTEAFQRVGRVPVLIEVTDDLSEYNLSSGSRAQVAVYSDHWHHLAVMRKILLRMSSWQNYLYLDH